MALNLVVTHTFIPLISVYTLIHIHPPPTQSLRSFPSVAFKTVPLFVWLTMAVSRLFKEHRLAFPLSVPLSSRRSMVWCPSLALCPQVVSQAPQHFGSSEKQATCEGCFARQLSARSFPFTPACPGQYTHGSCRRWMSTIDTVQSGLPIPLSLSVASSLNLWRWWHAWSDCRLLRQSSGGHGWLLPLPLPKWRLRPYRPHSLHGW